MQIMRKSATSLVFVSFGLIEGLVLLRFFLRLVGVSTELRSIAILYEISQIFIAPFQVLFPTPAIRGESVVEFASVFALFTYAFVGYLIQEILAILAVRRRR